MFQATLKELQKNAGRSRLALMRTRATVMKDNYYQSDQLLWINVWSGTVCLCLVLVYICEVYLIRRWFRSDQRNTSKFYVHTGMKMGL